MNALASFNAPYDFHYERVAAEQRPSGRAPEVPLHWFGATLWRYAPFYLELILISLCLRLFGLADPKLVIDFEALR